MFIDIDRDFTGYDTLLQTLPPLTTNMTGSCDILPPLGCWWFWLKVQECAQSRLFLRLHSALVLFDQGHPRLALAYPPCQLLLAPALGQARLAYLTAREGYGQDGEDAAWRGWSGGDTGGRAFLLTRLR